MNIQSVVLALSLAASSAPVFAQKAHTAQCHTNQVHRVVRAATIGFLAGLASRSMADISKRVLTDHFYVSGFVVQNLSNAVISGLDETSDCKEYHAVADTEKRDEPTCTEKKLLLETAASNAAFIIGAYAPDLLQVIGNAGSSFGDNIMKNISRILERFEN